MTRATISITDHAVLRYLERGAGIDIERVRRGIRNKVAGGVNLGAKSVTVDGFGYRIECDRVVTVVPANDSHEPSRVFGGDTKRKRRRNRRKALSRPDTGNHRG